MTMTAYAPATDEVKAGPASDQLPRLGELIGRPLRSPLDLANAVEEGVKTDVVARLLDIGLARSELDFVIPVRTLSHRVKLGQPLTPEESGRAVRVAHLVFQAEEVFGDVRQAAEWLRKPMRRFEGRTPLALAHTEQGAQLVEQVLGQAQEGYFA